MFILRDEAGSCPLKHNTRNVTHGSAASSWLCLESFSVLDLMGLIIHRPIILMGVRARSNMRRAKAGIRDRETCLHLIRAADKRLLLLCYKHICFGTTCYVSHVITPGTVTGLTSPCFKKHNLVNLKSVYT